MAVVAVSPHVGSFGKDLLAPECLRSLRRGLRDVEEQNGEAGVLRIAPRTGAGPISLMWAYTVGAP